MERTSPEVIVEIEDAIRGRLGSIFSPRQQHVTVAGGIDSVVELLRKVDLATEKAMLEGLESTDPDTANEIKKAGCRVHRCVFVPDHTSGKTTHDTASSTHDRAASPGCATMDCSPIVGARATSPCAEPCSRSPPPSLMVSRARVRRVGGRSSVGGEYPDKQLGVGIHHEIYGRSPRPFESLRPHPSFILYRRAGAALGRLTAHPGSCARWRALSPVEQPSPRAGAPSCVSRVYHGHLQREIGEKGNEHLGPVEGVRCVVTGRTSVPEPTWHENVLGIDTGVHIDGRGSGRPAAVSPARQPPRGTTRAGRYRTLWRGSNDGAVAPIA